MPDTFNLDDDIKSVGQVFPKNFTQSYVLLASWAKSYDRYTPKRVLDIERSKQGLLRKMYARMAIGSCLTPCSRSKYTY